MSGGATVTGTVTGTMLMSALKTDRDTIQAGDISSKIKAVSTPVMKHLAL